MRSPQAAKNKDAPVVLLQHGFLNSADIWILRKKLSVANQLAKAGFDVWLANSRGSKYSRNHKTLDANKNPEFWNFSFIEMGKYDLPATIDYIIKNTGQKKITYLAHSMGNSAMYYGLATNE
jgi:lysosomal acid lipase/cholesteryl ester hydrolase